MANNMMAGGGMDGQMMSDEPGSTDNRLSLDPSQFDFTQDWEDGQQYSVTVTVRQVSPGEYEVLDATEAETPAEDQTESAEEPTAPSGDTGYPNPAVAKMMRGMRK